MAPELRTALGEHTHAAAMDLLDQYSKRALRDRIKGAAAAAAASLTKSAEVLGREQTACNPHIHPV